MAQELNLKPETVVRVYIDVAADVEAKMRLRCVQLQMEHGKKFTRKEYLEHLVLTDCEKVKGASIREVSSRSKK